MTVKVDKLEQQIKALQAKKRAAKKQEKAKQEKEEFKRLKELEKAGAFKYAEQGKMLNDLLVKHGIKTFKAGFEILEQAIVSTKNQQ